MLAMFDSEVPIAEKAAMAGALLQHPVPDAFAPGKPGGRHFGQITPNWQISLQDGHRDHVC